MSIVEIRFDGISFLQYLKKLFVRPVVTSGLKGIGVLNDSYPQFNLSKPITISTS